MRRALVLLGLAAALATPGLATANFSKCVYRGVPALDVPVEACAEELDGQFGSCQTQGSEYHEDHVIVSAADFNAFASGGDSCVNTPLFQGQGEGIQAFADTPVGASAGATWHQVDNNFLPGPVCETVVSYDLLVQSGRQDLGCPLGPPPNPGWGHLVPAL